MSKPKAPQAPDPRETAQAQTGTNVATAIANASINQVDQYTPDGSTTYNQTGTSTFRDPTTGASYQIPRYSVTQQLSEGQQQIYDNNQEASQNLSRIGADQTDFLSGYLSRPISFDSLPSRAGINSNAGQLQSGYQQENLQRIQGTGPNFSNMATNAGLQRTGQNQPQLQNGYRAQGVSNDTNFGQQSGDANLQRSTGFNPQFQQGYNTEQLRGVGGETPRLQRQTGSANLQTDIDRTNLQGVNGETPQYQDSYVDDFSADRQRVEDALMSNLDRQHSRDQESLDARLASQGIKSGSEAYTRATSDFQEGKDRARLGAILNAGTEQSRLAGLARDQASFGNNARAQSFNDSFTQQGFNNNVAQQQFGQNQSAAAFGNAARQQDFQNNQSNVRENNQYSQQDFGNRIQGQGFNNSAAQGNNANNAALAAFGNNAQSQQFGAGLDAANFNNQAGQQQFQNNFQNQSFNNDVQQQQFQNSLAQSGFNNDLSRDQAAFRNAANQQAYGNSNQAALQNNQVAQGQFDNFNNSTAQNNQYSQQAYDNYVNQTGLNNAAIQQGNANRAGQAGFNNQAVGQGFNQQQGAANFQNANREAALQELLTLRNQPLNEISALMSGSQVSRPQQLHSPQVNIPTTDYAGLVQNNFANQQAIYQQQVAQRNNVLGGIFGLGSAAILSDRRLKENLKPVMKLANGLTLYAFNYIGGAVQKIGLMAQEVAKVNPSAVVQTPSGFMAVDYRKAVA